MPSRPRPSVALALPISVDPDLSSDPDRCSAPSFCWSLGAGGGSAAEDARQLQSSSSVDFRWSNALPRPLLKTKRVLSGCDCDPSVVLKPRGSISAMKLMQFQGLKHKASSPISLPRVKHLDLTPSPEVPLTIMKRKLMSTNDLQESRRLVKKIDRQLEVRNVIEKSVRKIVALISGSDAEVDRLLSQRAPLTAHDCYQAAVSHFRTHCFNWHNPTYEYALRHLYVLVNLCENPYPIDRIKLSMNKVCLGYY
ncbi:Legumain, partial [Eschrichtius robustus]|nr:Legumain [Eschrichtius robustus]